MNIADRNSWFNPKWLILLPLLALIYPDRFPLVYIDEMWHMDSALHFARNGTIALSTWGSFLDFDKVSFAAPFFHILLGCWFKIVGFGLLQARVFMVLMSVPYLYFTYWIAKDFYGEAVGVLSAAFLYLWWFHTFRYVRYDMPTGAFFVAAYFCFKMHQRSERRALYLFLAGLLSALGTLCQFYGIIGVLCLTVLTLRDYKLAAFARKQCYFFAAGVLIPIVWYLIYLHQHPILHDQLMLFNGDRVTFNSLRFYLTNIKNEPYRWFPIPLATTFTFFVPSFAIFLIVYRREFHQAPDIPLVSLIFFLGFGILIRNKVSIYLAQAIPFLVIGAAKLWVDIYSRVSDWLASRKILSPRAIGRLFATMVFLVIIARPAHAVYVIFHRYGYEDTDFMKLARNVKSYVPDNTVVCGIYPYWLGFPNQTFYVENYLLKLEQVKGISFSQAVRELKVDYLIVDDIMRYYHEGNPDIDNFLVNDCELVGTIRNKAYSVWPGSPYPATGETRIYRVRPSGK